MTAAVYGGAAAIAAVFFKVLVVETAEPRVLNQGVYRSIITAVATTLICAPSGWLWATQWRDLSRAPWSRDSAGGYLR